jgi:hypothetical protein
MIAKGVVAAAGTGTTLAEISQPGAKADDESFAEVEWLEQHPLHVFQRRADRLNHADFPGRCCHGLNRVHWYYTLFRARRSGKYILERKL